MQFSGKPLANPCGKRIDTALARNRKSWKIPNRGPFVGLGKWIVFLPRKAGDSCRAGSDKWSSGEMSFRAVMWAFDQEVRPSSKKFVLIALSNFASDTGLCYPAVATIAKLTSQKEDTIRDALDSLVSDGIITDTGKRCGATMQIKVYQLPERARDKTPETGSLKTVKTPIKTPIKTPELVGLCINNNLGTNGTADTEPELSIYEKYPRKVNKSDAIRAIQKALKEHNPQFLLSRTIEFAKRTKGCDIQFVPYPASWFNAGGYDSDPAEWSRIGRQNQKNGQNGQTFVPGSSNL